MDQALESVGDDMDIREDGIIYTAMAPTAAEIAQLYIMLRQFYKLVFAQTSEDDWLDRRTEESGIDRQLATKSIRRASFNIPVDIGERFFVEGLHYVVIGKDRVESEELGSVGNNPASELDMLPLSNIQGLETAVLGDVIIPGEEEETDESLLERFLVHRRREAESGNKAHYKKWATEVPGVGRAKVFPLWNGDGTVLIIIANSEIEPASSELIKQVNDYIDPVPGMGEGVAPIGATLTVKTAIYKEITISANVSLRGNNLEAVTVEVENSIKRLFKEVAFLESESDIEPDIKVSGINNVLFENEWIDDYTSVLINGSSENLIIDESEIPYLVEVNLIDQTR